MSASQPIDRLLRLQALAEQNGETDLAAWIGSGLEDYLFADAPLEAALGLNAPGRGKPNARRAYLEAQRNRAIWAAWCCCEGEPWPRSVALAQEVRKFQAIIWPRWSGLDNVPAGASELRRHLFVAHRCGSVPASPHRLQQIALLMQQAPV